MRSYSRGLAKYKPLALFLVPLLLGISCSAGTQSGSSQVGGEAGAGDISTAGQSTEGGASGAPGRGDDSAKVHCETTNDCAASVPETKPAGCAKASCDPKQKFCRFSAKDLDGDGDGADACASLDPSITVELGGDCDETDEKVSSRGWDGPEGLAGGEAQPNRCDDGLDNDCNGTVDDGALDDGTTCKCTPGEVQTCSQDSAGKTIVYPGGKPQGECTYGAQTCDDGGKWGPCTGAAGPTAEECNGKDDDCDAKVDEIADVLSPPIWTCDADSDNHAAAEPTQEKRCTPPVGPCGGDKGTWTASKLPLDDCDDDDATRFFGNPEVCDGVDNDCDGEIDDNATTPATWYLDADGDKHVLAAGLKKTQCQNPGATGEACPGGAPACPDSWLTSPVSREDCDDTNPARHPGAWDGPQSFASRGIKAPGWSVAYYNPVWPVPSTTPLATAAAPVVRAHWGWASPLVGLPAQFSDRWTGTLLVPSAGSYSFHVWHDDNVRIVVGGQKVYDAGCCQTNAPSSVDLEAGQLSIVIEHLDGAGAGDLAVDWSGPGFARMPLRVADNSGDQPGGCGDGIDNDCNQSIDDGLATGPGQERGCPAQACTPGEVGACDGMMAGSLSTQNVGACRNGLRVCSSGGVWGSCQEAVNGKAESCNGVDDDCDGTPDEGNPGGGGSCSTGLNALCGTGVYECSGGAVVCKQVNYPLARDCASPADNDCSGGADNVVDGSYCKCTLGSTQGCSTVVSYNANGSCNAGARTCVKAGDGSSSYGACTGSAYPAESCQTQRDNNCDGRVGNASGCIGAIYMVTPPSWPGGCNPLPTEGMATTDSTEAGYKTWAFLRLWSQGSGNDAVQVNRCVCSNYHTTAIDQSCESLGCASEGTMGYLSRSAGPGKEPVYRVNLNTGAVGYCSSFFGCLTLSCGVWAGTTFYAPT